MSNYKLFSKDYQEYNANEVWDQIIKTTSVNSEFQSVEKTPKIYKVESINNDMISFSGGDRKETESISHASLIKVMNELILMKVFNTNNSKQHFKETKNYSKDLHFLL